VSEYFKELVQPAPRPGAALRDFGDDEILCWYDPMSDTAECEGVECSRTEYIEESAGKPVGAHALFDELAPYGTFYCVGGCSVDFDQFTYTCDDLGGGDVEQGDGSGGGGEDSCPPENPLCELPLRPSDTLQFHAAIDSSLLRTDFTIDSVRVECTILFNALKSSWITDKGGFFRGNVAVADSVGDDHDGYTAPNGDIHIDQDYLDANVSSGNLLGLLLHETAHRLGYSHPNNILGGEYIDYPFNYTSPLSSPNPNSCVG
jgi:hypothetical protein